MSYYDHDELAAYLLTYPSTDELEAWLDVRRDHAARRAAAARELAAAKQARNQIEMAFVYRVIDRDEFLRRHGPAEARVEAAEGVLARLVLQRTGDPDAGSAEPEHANGGPSSATGRRHATATAAQVGGRAGAPPG